jgi:cytochrome c oxidase subunit 2
MLALLLMASVSYAQDAAAAPSGAAPAGPVSSYTYGYWLPPVASEHGPQIDKMINVLHWFMGVIFVGWGIFFGWCLVKFRARPGHKADPTHIKAKSTKVIEILVAAFEVVLLVGFSIPLWAQAKTQIPDEKDAFVVHVSAEQFAWNVHYPGVAEDASSPTGYRYTEFGRTSPGLVSLATGNYVGLDSSDENAADDVQIQGTLRVPLNKTVLIKLSSKDVIHSLYLPVMRVKQDAIPGMQIPVWFKPVEKGVSQIQCAQLCGNNHSIMKGTLIVEDEKDVQKWISEQHAAASATFEE